ncbi:MAG: DsbA family protein [Paludibacteraceae bacterium]
MGTKVLEIIEFTDPVCVWCWGSEPMLRAIDNHYGSQVKTSYIMGGLVKDMNAFYDSYNNIGGDPEAANKNIAAHWVEASERHGMPVKVEGLKLFSKDHPSTYPQNIAYKAAQMQDEALANRFLRRIREASATETRQTNLTEVLVELASETGLDIARFLDDFTNGKAKAAFEDDLYTTAQYRVHGFPSFLIKYGEKSMLLRGYQSYNNFKAVISNVSNDAIQATQVSGNEEDVLDFIKKYDNLAPLEIKMTFDFSDVELENRLNLLLEKQLISKREVGNGYFISVKNNPLTCDIETGVCM